MEPMESNDYFESYQDLEVCNKKHVIETVGTSEYRCTKRILTFSVFFSFLTYEFLTNCGYLYKVSFETSFRSILLMCCLQPKY